MRHGLFCLILAAAVLSARGQDKIVDMFDGASNQTTATFAVKDKWELRWKDAGTLTLTVINPNGTIVAGTAVIGDGSLYQPGGGTFYLQILGAPAAGAKSWHIDVVQLGAGPSSSATAYAPPAGLPSPANKTATEAGPTPSLTNAPSAIIPAGPAPASAMVERATDAQTRAIVLVQGDRGQGTGFLTHDKKGVPIVITNNHVLFANPNVRITTTDGRQVPVLAYRGASDRDLVMMTIKDDHYAYLDVATDVDHLVHEDDAVLTPGNSEGGGVLLDTAGEIRAIGPNEIEISNPIFHGNSGGPVLHAPSGKVVGVVTRGALVRPSDFLDAASLANSHSAITGTMRYFAVRIDTVPAWEDYDLNRFLTETTFLHDFHKQSRFLDSLMNGATYEKAHLPVTTGEEGRFPSAHLFESDDRLRGMAQSYHDQAQNADKSQQMDALREFCSGLGDYASAGMTEIQQPQNFYAFDRLEAKAEISYRQHLIDELDKVGDKIGDLGH